LARRLWDVDEEKKVRSWNFSQLEVAQN